MKFANFAGALLVCIGLSQAAFVVEAQACGCLSPPVPEFNDDEYAVNQQAEQIVFEVEEGEFDETYITAHVLIRYAGAPSNFAWIVPVPNVPELELSEEQLFGIFDNQTEPLVLDAPENVCPDQQYLCRTPNPCPTFNSNNANNFNNFNNANNVNGGGGDPGGVNVIDRQQIGSYDTVTFAAQDAQLAVQWLEDEGFIVNDTMTPYMQPYLDAGMVFVASKLIAGAGIDQIKPLKMRYQAEQPMIPLQLTAVAAEPHLTVTAYILGREFYAPDGHPVVEINDLDIGQDLDGRSNYPMVMARAIDEANGDGFVIEYQGINELPLFIEDTEFGCCGQEFDGCNLGFDGVCQCPLDEFDAEDCGEAPELVAGAELFRALAEKHQRVTRITTRLSPHEMTFDPSFTVVTDINPIGRLRLDGGAPTLNACVSDVVGDDVPLFESIRAQQACASVYCGDGSCALLADGTAGCVCDPGNVARQFTDLDGIPSVTCVPDINTVDFAADGLQLPGACKGRTCGSGTCIDVGGFATCDCPDGFAAGVSTNGVPVPTCVSTQLTLDAGARNYTEELRTIEVCMPRPPACNGGWLIDAPNVNIIGSSCGREPAPERFETIVLECPDEFGFNNDPGADPDPGEKGELKGCATASPSSLLGLILFLAFARIRRRD